MISFIKRLFRKKSPKIISQEELFITNFKDSDSLLFSPEEGDGYKSYFQDGYTLELNRKDLYAWSTSYEYQWKDIVLDAQIDFSEIHKMIPDSLEEIKSINQSGYCAYGVLFRYVNDNNFYSVLISDGGYFRMDVMFNGNQLPIIGWTQFPSLEHTNTEEIFSKDIVNLKIIANGTKFSIVINGKTCVNLDDDTIQSEGYIAYAAQNWQMYEKVTATLKNLTIESRDIYVDSSYRQWSYPEELTPQDNLRNAESLGAVGNYIGALLELEQLWKKRSATIKELLLGARLYMAQGLYEDCEKLMLQALNLDKDSIEVKEQYASLLYLWGKIPALETFLQENETHNSALLFTFTGHIHSENQNWKAALAAYENAEKLSENEPMHKINSASCLDKLNKNANAFEKRFDAALLFCQLKSFEDMQNTIISIEEQKLTPKQKNICNFLKGKLNYSINNFEEGITYLTEFIEKLGKTDKNKKEFALYLAESHYILSTLYRESGNVKEALENAKAATELHNTNSQYFSYYGDLLFAINEIQSAKEIITEACKLNQSDGYIWNLLASIALEQDNLEEAQSHIFTALSLLPEDLSILKNYIIIMTKLERFEEALGVLDAAAFHSGYGRLYRAQALHLAGNLLRDIGKLDEAEKRYIDAINLTPKNQQLLADYASLCIECDRLNEADSILCSTITEESEIPDYIVRLLASISLKKGDFPRSEVLLRQAIETKETNNQDCGILYLDLVNLYAAINKMEKAEETADILLENGYTSEYQEAQQIIDEKTKDSIECANCKRVWYIPKNISEMGNIRLTAQPPDELPAGNCPECGKIFCIGCAKEYLDKTGRFQCAECKTYLKLQHKGIPWLLYNWMKTQKK